MEYRYAALLLIVAHAAYCYRRLRQMQCYDVVFLPPAAIAVAAFRYRYADAVACLSPDISLLYAMLMPALIFRCCHAV